MTNLKLLFSLLFLVIAHCSLYAQCPGNPPLAFTFESTESRCESNGTITLHITGGTPFNDPNGNQIYNNTIIAPIVTPIGGQADSVFAALAAGTYTVEVVDANGCSVTHQVTVPGTHMQLELTPTWGDATCDGLGGGWICGTPDEGRPWPPGYYEYQLFNAATNPPTPLGPKGLDSCFTDLAAGSYQIRAYDSCNNFQTRDVILATTTYSSSLTFNYFRTVETCDTGCAIIYIYEPFNNAGPWGEFPYTWEVISADTSLSELVGQTGELNGYREWPNYEEADTICFSPPYADGRFTVRITDVCGSVATRTVIIPEFRFFTFDGYDCDEGGYASISSTYTTNCEDGTVNYEIISGPTGFPLPPPQDTGYWSNLPTGNYCFRITDCCGNVATDCEGVLSPAWTIVVDSAAIETCVEGWVGFDLNYRTNGGPSATGLVAVVTSAPAGYPDPLPDTLPYYFRDIEGPVGNYCVLMYDQCNYRDSICFDVSDTIIYNTNITVVPGCVTGNQLMITSTGNIQIEYDLIRILPSYSSLGIDQTQTNWTNLIAGTYIIDWENHDPRSSQFCDLKKDTVVIPEYVPPAITGAWGIECDNGAGLITVQGSGGNTPYTYELFQGPVTRPLQSSPTFPGLPGGTYDIRLNDNCNNSAITTVSIEPFVPVIKGYGGSFCIGDTARLYVDYFDLATYSWSGPNGVTSDTSEIIIPNIQLADAGTYTIDIDVKNPDQTACVAQQLTIVVDVFDCECAIDAFTATMVDCANAANGSATANMTSGSGGPFTYVWSNGANTQTINNLGPGTYSVTITDVGGCSVSGDTTITQPATGIVSIASNILNVACYGDASGAATYQTSGGSPPYTLDWSTGQQDTGIQNGGQANASGLTAGTYFLTITDTNGCTLLKSFTITENDDLIAAVLNVTEPVCFGESTGQATYNPSGGIPPYMYTWDTGETTQTATGLSAGFNYTTVTDALGCTKTYSLFLFQPPQLTCTIVGVPVTCNGDSDGSATATVTGGVLNPGNTNYQYMWSTGATTSGINNLTAGTYMLTVMDDNGCMSTCSVNIAEPDPLLITLVGTNLLCNGDNSGAIDMTVTGGNDCRGGNGGGTTQTLGNNDTYIWSNGSTTEDISGLSAGTYSVTVTDCKGCVATSSIVITEPPALMATAVGTNLLCNGDNSGSIDLTVTNGTPAYSYNWSNGMTVEDPTGLAAGTYSVTVTDDNGCTATTSVSLTEPDVLTATAVGTDLLCFNDASGTVSLTVTGGTPAYSYNWSNGATTPMITGLSGGTYMATVTDGNGCIATTSTTINEPPLLTVTATSTEVTCYGGSDGTASSTTTGGTPGYTYEWSNGETDKDITGLTAGTYTLTVTDMNECTATTSVVVIEPPVYSCDMTVVSDVTCFGYNNGVAMAGATGGTPGYTYQWDSGQSDQTISGLSAGTYTVTITDSRGCPLVCSVMVNEPPKIEATVDVTHVSCFSDSDGSATVTATGGVPGYTYQWDAAAGGQTTSTATGLSAGTYSVSVTDMNGCCYIASAVINAPVCDPCQQAEDGVLDICAEIDADPNHPLATLDCDGGGIINSIECEEGTDPLDPSDECTAATAGNVDICALIDGDASHPLANVDCDNGGVLNIDECNTGQDPLDPIDDCQAAIDGNLNICALINYDPNHPLANQDCDNGGVINITECQTGDDPSDPGDDCEAAADSGMDICAILTANPGHPWASLDCDEGGIDNQTECDAGTDPGDPSDDIQCDPCTAASESGQDICVILAGNPNHPLSTLDCDGGGVLNIDECNNGGDPLDPSDDCDVLAGANIDICVYMGGIIDHPLASLDCDNGGVINILECISGEDPTDPSDDCQTAIDEELNICALINYDPTHPLASADCDGGGVINITECNTGEDPSDPGDDCESAVEADMDICTIIAGGGHPWATLDCDHGGVDNETECNNGGDPNDPSDDPTCPIDPCVEAAYNGDDICDILDDDPTHPLSTLDCDNGGVDNQTECDNGNDPEDPDDDCEAAEAANMDICAMILADPTHPLADVDCDNGGVINIDECNNGDDPFDPSDDCQSALDLNLNICALINYDASHPLAQLDCDGGGVLNITECNTGEDPSDPADDCEAAAEANMDICLMILNGQPGWASLDCDHGGIINAVECANGGDPSDPQDDLTCPSDPCEEAAANNLDVCDILASDPTNPIGTLDCDNGGVDNQTECDNGGDPEDPDDDCTIATTPGVDLCAIISNDPSNPLATQDCDNGGVSNEDECNNGGDPSDPNDDCQVAIDAGMNLCVLINYDPNHPLAQLDCDNGGVINITECETGEDPSDPGDDCEAAVEADMDICTIIAGGGHPWATLDCDRGGVDNETECNNGGDPNDPIDDQQCPFDPCVDAEANNTDICAEIAADPNSPLATLDCDNGGIDNQTECNNGGDPNDPDDDCTVAENGGVDLCTILANDPSNPLGDEDCDKGGVSNQDECDNGGDPFEPSDDCDVAIGGGLDLCLLIGADPNHPLASMDCDDGGIDNYIECTNGGDPTDPADDCWVAVTADIDICGIILTTGLPWGSLDCDNGGVDNGTECATGGDPNDPGDDVNCPLDACELAEENNTDICAVIAADPNHPLATEDCDNGGVINQTECDNGGDPNDPSDDCDIASQPGVDICTILASDPNNPLGDADCDNGGVSNQDECDNGGDPYDPSDDCQAAIDGNINICLIIFGDPNHPLASLDCDNGGIDNYTECASGEDPTDPADDCDTVIDEDLEICSIIIGANGNHPLATLDCDNGGVDNAHECQHQTDTNEPSDDCLAVIRCNLDVCAIIDGDPNHPLADQDCDGGGMDNWSECQHGGDPNNPADDCIAAVADTANICLIIYNDPDHPMASTDCDNGGVPNWYECQNGEDPLDPADDCETSIDVGGDICTIILTHPTSPIATLDCDGGGVDNETECDNGGDPADPLDDCTVAIALGEDICAIINGDPNHPMAGVDCDNGGIDNGTECDNGGDPADPSDDCTVAKAAGVDVCVLIAYDPNHPLATKDCDNGGVDNYTECVDAANDPCDPADDCESAVDAGMDICAILTANPGHPWATMDCDNGGIDNETECADGGDPSDPIDDGACPPDLCEEAYDGNMDICAEISLDPNNPMGTMDCDKGGIDNQTECDNGGDPLDPDDDCVTAINAGLDLCVLIGGDPTHPMASLDCDGGGIINITECMNGEDPSEPSDDCQAAIDAGVNICQIINYDPTHPMATLDCDNGGIDNWTECNNGGDPSEPSDDCAVVVNEGIDICTLLTDDPTNPIGNSDCDEDGVTNADECTDGTDPLDPCDFDPGSITGPVTADQSDCPNLCPDLTPITTILPGNIAGVSGVCVSVEVSELNSRDTDGSTITVQMPSDPRFTFMWDSTATICGLLPFNNADWKYLGNNGFVHTFEYAATNPVITGGNSSTFGFAATYDPQSTDGQTTITATIRPFSGGECNILNNTDSERLVYFE